MESDEDPDVVIDVINDHRSPPSEPNSFLDWSVVLTVLAATLLILLVILLIKRSERRRRPQPPDSSQEGWIESSEEHNTEELRSKRIHSFNTRMQTSIPSEGLEVIRCGPPTSGLNVTKRPNSNTRDTNAPILPKGAKVEMKPDTSLALKPRSSKGTQQFSLKSHPREVTLPLCPTSGLPCISPLQSLEELHFWHSGQDPWNVATIPLQVSERHKHNGEPKTMLCHDMMGGYQYDKYPQGHWELRNYCFYHWPYIDSFVYFSHNFVTIPPSCWTNSAHTHSVLSLGTVITEGEKGYLLCLEMLKNSGQLGRAVDQLLAVMRYYAFDGWLINIENPLPATLIGRMVDFLRQLTFGVKRINPEGLVIWYDAVTTRGELRWQNSLNPLNKPFFDACDGIFLNYHWSDPALRDSRTLADARALDVYVGVDVFGRGVQGGGEWNTDFAMRKIQQHNLSAALFAPGWVYENLPKDKFLFNQTKFWEKLIPYMKPHPYVQQQFVTSFCRGMGAKGFSEGRQLLSTAWTNHSAQQLQPHFLDEYYHLGKSKNNILVDQLCVSSALGAYNGAECLVCKGEVFRDALGSDSRLVIRLFVTEVPFVSPLFVTYTYKDEPRMEENVRHLLELNLSNQTGPKYVVLDPKASLEAPEQLDRLDERLLNRYGYRRSPALPLEDVGVQGGRGQQLLGFGPMYPEYMDQLDALTTDRANEKWRTAYFLIAHKDIDNANIREIRLNLLPPSNPQDFGNNWKFCFSLGQIKIIDPACLKSFAVPVDNLKASNAVWRKQTQNSLDVSFLLKWTPPPPMHPDQPSHYNIYTAKDEPVTHGNAEFLGQVFTNCFFVNKCNIKMNPEREYSLFVVVQCVNRSGLSLAVKGSAKLNLTWTD